jgi:enoyl-CoA hydratase/carnithine racemase
LSRLDFAENLRDRSKVIALDALEDLDVTLGDDHVATIEIQRPPHNYFDTALVASLADAFEALDAEPECRTLLLVSKGKNFCAGARLTPAASNEPVAAPAGADERHLYEHAARLFSTRKVVVAAIQGAAVGGGLGLALMADFRVACSEARFSANFARLGFHQGFALSVTLPWVIGHQRSTELLYTGRRVGGEEALEIGLCDRIVDALDLRDEARAFAAEIAASAPMAVESIRATMRGDLAERAATAMAREKQEQDRLRKTDDFREGLRAMAERSVPKFRRS